MKQRLLCALSTAELLLCFSSAYAQDPAARSLIPVAAPPRASQAGFGGRPSAASPEVPRPVYLTISGGISLGSYQAGLNWILVEFFRRSAGDSESHAFEKIGLPSPQAYRLAGATGASAGNVNALISGVQWCGVDDTIPERSVFWRTWVSTGWEQLFPRDGMPDTAVRKQGVFTREFFERHHANVLDAALARPGGPCIFPVGVTLTRLTPFEVHLPGTSIHAEVQRFFTAFELRRAWRQDALAILEPPAALARDSAMGEQVVLPPDRDTTIPLRNVMAAVEASSAFPLAFAPKHLRYYWPDSAYAPPGNTGRITCALNAKDFCREPEDAPFVDGGVFDNNPLDLAVEIDRHYSPHTGEGEPVFIYINPDAMRGPLAGRAAGADVASPAGIAAVGTLLGGALPSARQYELQALFRRMNGDSHYPRPSQVRTTDRYYPLAGDHLYSFSAFLGRPFREYDFYVGMYDGLKFIAEEAFCATQRTHVASVTTSTAVPRDACVAEVMSRFLEQKPIPLGNTAPALLDSLFVWEYHPARIPNVKWKVPPTLRGGRLGVHLLLSPAQTDTIRSVVLQQLARANRQLIDIEVDREGQANACRGTVAQLLLCFDHFELMLKPFATPEVKSIVQQWNADTANCGRPMPGRIGRILAHVRDVSGKALVEPSDLRRDSIAENCLADGTFVDLLKRPELTLDDLVGAALHQLARVEDMQPFRGKTREVAIADLLYRASGVRTVHGALDPFPTTIPAWANAGAHVMVVLPYSLGASIGTGGVEAAFEPTIHITRKVAVIFPAGFEYHLETREGVRSYGGGGFGANVATPGLPFASNLVGSLDLLATAHDGPQSVADVRAGIVGGKLRIGARMPVGLTARHLRDPVTLSLSVTDVSGVIYWIYRMSR